MQPCPVPKGGRMSPKVPGRIWIRYSDQRVCQHYACSLTAGAPTITENCVAYHTDSTKEPRLGAMVDCRPFIRARSQADESTHPVGRRGHVPWRVGQRPCGGDGRPARARRAQPGRATDGDAAARPRRLQQLRRGQHPQEVAPGGGELRGLPRGRACRKRAEGVHQDPPALRGQGPRPQGGPGQARGRAVGGEVLLGVDHAGARRGGDQPQLRDRRAGRLSRPATICRQALGERACHLHNVALIFLEAPRDPEGWRGAFFIATALAKRCKPSYAAAARR
ncbi:hypothetical protein OF001_U350014 [Pseudomonas sp. OF001]|nr:hypothetical protein OF001_U350014 [Pseudomonas sp. OF001]